jgi:hypothetical protein
VGAGTWSWSASAIVIDASVAQIQERAQVGVAEQALRVLRRAEVDPEERPFHGAPLGPTDAIGGAVDENERNDRARQQDREDRAEVMLKILLNPSDHGNRRR